MVNSLLLEARLDRVEARLDKLQKVRTFAHVIPFALLFCCTMHGLCLFPPRSPTFAITVERSSMAIDGAQKMVPARTDDDEGGPEVPSSGGVCLNPELGEGALFSDDRAVARFRKCGGQELVDLYEARKAGGIIAGISERDAARDAYLYCNNLCFGQFVGAQANE